MTTNNAPATTETANDPLPAGTRVLNTSDGEPGSIMNGYAKNTAGWTEYEVQTAHGIEIWKTAEFIRLDDLPRD